MPEVRCKRCGRIIADSRKGGGEHVVNCPRCHEPNQLPA